MKTYLLIGHFAKDILENKDLNLGGTVYYSGITAKNLGARVRILTSFGKDLEKKIKEKNLFEKFEIKNIPSKNSTTFKIVYQGQKRSLFLYSKARKISPGFFPEKWKKSSILHFGPIFQEIDEKIIKKFKGSKALIGASLQGWLRNKDKKNRVSFSFWRNYKKILPLFDVAILSDSDLNFDLNLAKEYAKYVKILVLTLGKDGCQVFARKKIKKFKPKKIFKSGNFVGAGDVFAAAFLIEFKKTKNPFKAARFANFSAGFHIEKGIENLLENQKILPEL